MSTLQRRVLKPPDEPALRAFWAERPEAHIFAIPDLDYLGWKESMLEYLGWFDGDTMVATAMIYGSSAQWEYRDERAIPDLVAILDGRYIRFASGIEPQVWAVVNQLAPERLEHYEQSYVSRVMAAAFNRSTLHRSPGRIRRATLHDLEPLAALHVAAPDQFNSFDLTTRRRLIRGALTDGWRRLYLAETPGGEVVASAQSQAEGTEMAVVGGVVTHPDWRGLGYGTAVTAHLTAALLDDGLTPYLYYRRDNLPAQRAYHAIGYEDLDDVLLVKVKSRWTK